MLKHGDILGNRYMVEGLIARGGMGAVYRAQDLKLKNKVWAVKEIFNDKIEKDEFIDEVRILTELSHPYIPSIVDYFEPNEDGYCYIVMELIHGQTIQEIFEQLPSRLQLGKIVKYAFQLSDVLGYLHEQPRPVIFRDLKPSNVMIDQHDNIKLIDFGIARNFKQGQMSDTVAFGTIAFASPEQLENRQTDNRSDLYSLGAMLYYLLTGGKHYYASSPSISSLSLGIRQDLSTIIDQLLEANPSQRFQNARSVQTKLEVIAYSLSASLIASSDQTVQLTNQQTEYQRPKEPMNTVKINMLSGEIQPSDRTELIHTNEITNTEEIQNQYEIQASQSTPALIIYLIDVSASMSLPLGEKRRIDAVSEALSSVIKQMVFRSTKGMRLSSRYRIAILAYSNEVYDLLGGVKTIEEVAKIGVPKLALKKFTDTAKAFLEAEKILQAEIPNMQNCPAPLICHMTDGASTGEDPKPIAKRIMDMSVPDGNVLIENIFISDSVLKEPIDDVKRWRGITPNTKLADELSEKLRDMSSVIPESYREMMSDSTFSVEKGSLMMFPGNDKELVALGFQMSAATPVR